MHSTFGWCVSSGGAIRRLITRSTSLVSLEQSGRVGKNVRQGSKKTRVENSACCRKRRSFFVTYLVGDGRGPFSSISLFDLLEADSIQAWRGTLLRYG